MTARNLAREFEDRGEYENARRALTRYWRRIGEHPKVEGLESSTAGEVLLRAGVVTGLIGSKDQISHAQEKAKDLISQSLTLFQSTNYRKKIAEAQTELALCYWRTGEYDEARVLLEETLPQLSVDNELKAKTVLRLSIVQLEVSALDRALRTLTDYAPLFEKINNQTLKGSYRVTLGNILEKLWETAQHTEYLDRALVEFSAASYHFEQAEHRCYLANTENNLALLYFTINRYEEAHQHLDHARRVLETLRDVSGIAQVDETRACVFSQTGPHGRSRAPCAFGGACATEGRQTRAFSGSSDNARQSVRPVERLQGIIICIQKIDRPIRAYGKSQPRR
jgi:tetratricopeptide (TPR) repeat protein